MRGGVALAAALGLWGAAVGTVGAPPVPVGRLFHIAINNRPASIHHTPLRASPTTGTRFIFHLQLIPEHLFDIFKLLLSTLGQFRPLFLLHARKLVGTPLLRLRHLAFLLLDELLA